MAAWGGLGALFENPKPKNPTLIESLSPWNQIMPKKPPEEAAGFTEIFGELHFQEKLQLCTERLGSESSDNVDRLTTKELEESSGSGLNSREKPKTEVTAHEYRTCSAARARTGVFPPPPISSARRSGKSWIYFKSCREDGRLVLRKVTAPTQELLHASRGEGRLKLHLVLPDEATPKGGEEHEEQEETTVEDTPPI
ncbi:protein FANTASTIC FOUR 3-like [Curcuma longa]|uniref:protein FANTASTIC FOUR 3-like n=1 Tax=Curcuma longa TaxID=136217 RepID=UPI003D9F4E29